MAVSSNRGAERKNAMTRSSKTVVCAGVLSSAMAALAPSSAARQAPAAQAATTQASIAPQRALVNRYCVTCHNANVRRGDLRLDTIDLSDAGKDAATLEKVVRKMRAGMMPPAGVPRPDKATYDGLTSWLETELDRAAASTRIPAAPKRCTA